MPKKEPHEVDVHVGKAVLARRRALGISQTTLAEHLGVTFQQVQKYEKGTNRISGSRLFQMAEVLRVPVAHFFEGNPDGDVAPPLNGAMLEDDLTQFILTIEGKRLNTAFAKIKSGGQRRAVVDLVRAVARDD